MEGSSVYSVARGRRINRGLNKVGSWEKKLSEGELGGSNSTLRFCQNWRGGHQGEASGSQLAQGGAEPQNQIWFKRVRRREGVARFHCLFSSCFSIPFGSHSNDRSGVSAGGSLQQGEQGVLLEFDSPTAEFNVILVILVDLFLVMLVMRILLH